MRRVEAAGAPGQKWHVASTVGVTSCGIDLYDLPLRQPARRVAVEDRCRRVGCSRYWPALLRAVS